MKNAVPVYSIIPQRDSQVIKPPGSIPKARENRTIVNISKVDETENDISLLTRWWLFCSSASTAAVGTLPPYPTAGKDERHYRRLIYALGTLHYHPTISLSTAAHQDLLTENWLLEGLEACKKNMNKLINSRIIQKIMTNNE